MRKGRVREVKQGAFARRCGGLMVGGGLRGMAGLDNRLRSA